MSDTTVIILEKVLGQLLAEYKQCRSEINLATYKAHTVEVRVRAIAELIERESAGSEFQYSQTKILENCGLKDLTPADTEDKK
jgi:hypothetical protein